MSCRRHASAASLAACVATLFVAHPVTATPFVHETVEFSGNVGQYCSLALDAQGNPHVSYYDASTTDLIYATKQRGIWRRQTVDATGATGLHTSIAIDSRGRPHISYYNSTNGDLTYATWTGSAWLIEIVESTNLVGLFTSIALDADGEPHISYFDTTNDDLRYATRSSGVWTSELVDGTGSVGQYTSIEIDAFGRPHISYQKVDTADLKYAVKNTGVWVLEVVEAAGSDFGFDTSLALDAQGNPRISHHDNFTGELRYSAKTAGAWTSETVDTDGQYTSLALDASGNPRISYYALNTGTDLRYATKSGSVWTTETVDALGSVGLYSSLALDAQGNPRIAYFDTSNDDLRLADAAVHLVSPLGGERWPTGSVQTIRWSGSGTVTVQISEDGGQSFTTLLTSVSSNEVGITVPALTTDRARIRVTRASPASTTDSPGYFSIAPDLVSPWWTTAVDAAGDVGKYTSLALDANGAPRISYNGTFDLKYAEWTGGAWVIQTVDPGGNNTGEASSLTLDALGNPHVSHYDASVGDLKYATRAGGVWSIETPDAVGNVGLFTSVAVDAQNNPRIAYYDVTNLDLKFASKNGGVWTIETVDAGGDVGRFCSLELDRLGNPHIAYLDLTGLRLKYASKTTGAWLPEQVEAIRTPGYYASLELDGRGQPHIAYQAGQSAELRYAAKLDGQWEVENVEFVLSTGDHASLVLDGEGNPHISTWDSNNFDLHYATRTGGVWWFETVDFRNDVGRYTSIAVDAQGNPRISYRDEFSQDLKYASSAIELIQPSAGATWPVGASRVATWNGTGRADFSLSTDGGSFFALLAPGLIGGEYRMIVPHTPTRFAQARLERAIPHSVSATAGLFKIETAISLLALAAQPLEEGAGVLISWSSDPGPEDLAGYTLERAEPGSGGAAPEPGWRTLVSLTRETSFRDASGGAGARYRLSATNGLGETFVLGETMLPPSRPLAAWPLPYSGGDLNVAFAIYGRLGDASGRAEVGLYDLAGRLVRTLARGTFAGTHRIVTWDGRNAAGHLVADGVYFLVNRAGSDEARLKVVVIR